MRIPKVVVNFKHSVYKSLVSKPEYDLHVLDGIKEVKLISEDSGEPNFPLLFDNSQIYSVNGKPFGGGSQLTMIYNKVCPIVDGRLISNMTFALRFRNFLEGIQVADAASDEELDMLKSVADSLLDWQLQTAEDQHEIDYLKRVGVWRG